MNFMKFRKVTYMISLFLLSASLVSMFFIKKFNFGIDFTGGLEIQVKFNEHVSESGIRDALTVEEFGSIVVQRAGQVRDSLFIIKARKKADSTSANTNAMARTNAAALSTVDLIEKRLVEKFGNERMQLPFQKVDDVGPRIGDELKNLSYKLIIISLIAILVYVTIRFQFKFAVASIIALVHDVTITLGVFSYLEKEINIPIIAAVLFIIGYSLNDTIVVFDRIRENIKIMHGQAFENIINSSIMTTMNRTIITSVTTLLAAVSLYVWGGAVIHDFALAFIIGIIAGTYSSIFVASPVLFECWGRDARAKVR